MRNLTITLGLTALTVLGACTEREDVLPGERLGIREVLQGPSGESPIPENSSRPIALAVQTVNADWPQSAVSPFARTAHPGLSLPLNPAWSVSIGQGDKRKVRLNTDPVAAGGRIYTIDSANMVRATAAASGDALWSFDLTPLRDKSDQAQGGGLAVEGGRLYVSSGFGTLSALDAGTGAEIWTQRLDVAATGAPTVRNGVVYLTSGDKIGWAVEAEDGRVRWQIEGLADTNNVAGAPAPAVNDQRVIFAFGNGTIQSAFLQGGLRLWNADVVGSREGFAISTVSDITGDPLIDGNTVYAGNHSGRLVAFDVDSGERRWTALDGALDAVWPAGDSVFFVSDRYQLIRVDARDGSRIWAVDLPGYEPTRKPQKRRDSAYAHHGPVLAGGQLIVASSDGQLRAFNPENGALISSTPIDGGATTRPIVAGGVLYVVSGKGQLHAFR
nr:PQQ-binding-like beta-propeller repeat protein [Puniceibacterium sp. IMCC21224]